MDSKKSLLDDELMKCPEFESKLRGAETALEEHYKDESFYQFLAKHREDGVEKTQREIAALLEEQQIGIALQTPDHILAEYVMDCLDSYQNLRIEMLDFQAKVDKEKSEIRESSKLPFHHGGIQAQLDALSEIGRQERVSSQLVFGELLSALRAVPQDAIVCLDYAPTGICNPHSYRGYYEDLAFEPSIDYVTVKEVLDILENQCLGKTFTGYKGGDYTCQPDTVLWMAKYGSTADSRKIVDSAYAPSAKVFMLITKLED